MYQPMDRVDARHQAARQSKGTSCEVMLDWLKTSRRSDTQSFGLPLSDSSREHYVRQWQTGLKTAEGYSTQSFH